MTTNVWLLIPFLSFLLLAAGVAQQRTPVVPQTCVTYGPFSPDDSNVAVSRITTPPQLNDSDKIGSPQGTKWLVQSSPDYMKSGPWNTTILIGDQRGAFLKFEASNHANGGVEAKWLNEKLLFVQVWAGRLASDDLILDVTTGRFIYAEEAGYDCGPTEP